MGDYLNHVAARVSGGPPAVRPSLPSLFEPPKALASTRISSLLNVHRDEGLRTVTEELDAPAQAARSIATPVAQRAPYKRPVVPVPAFVEAPEEPNRPSNPSPAPAATGISGREVERSLQDVSQEPARAARPNSIVPVAITHQEAHADRPEPASRPRHVTNELSESRGIDTAGQERPPQRDTPPREPVRIREVQVVERTTSASAQPERAAPFVPARIQQVNAVKPSPQVSLKEAVESAAPSVQVVIGRVTIQAVTPAPQAPPAPPRPQAPRLSLEEYLKRREARG